MESPTVTPTVSPFRRHSKSIALDPLNFALIAAAALILTAAYKSVLPLAAAILYCGTSLLVLCLPLIGGRSERTIFMRVFAVGVLMASIAAIYANYLNDPGQLHSDAGGFFDMAAGGAKGLTLEQIQSISTGSLSIVAWEKVYNFFAALGFPRERYIGVLLNVSIVALAAVLALKMAREIYGEDRFRFKRLTTMFASCGLFWLFAGIHVRDAMILLTVTGLSYAWTHFLARPDFGLRLLLTIACSLLLGTALAFLRAEFLFVPVAMLPAGLLALAVGRKGNSNRAIAYVLVLIGLGVAVSVLANFGIQIQDTLRRGSEAYYEFSSQSSGTDSLGLALIVNQPLGIKVVLGTIYLFLFPIPFWSGLQLQSAYALFKSFNVVFFYFLLPLIALAIHQLWKSKRERTPALVFAALVSLGFAATVAGTSLETRHFGAFLVPVFLVALFPDLRDPRVRRKYRQLVTYVLAGVVIVHLAWVFLKV